MASTNESTVSTVSNGTNGHKVGQKQRKKNDSQGGWVVQKFGGTSVGKFPVNIAEDIVKYVFFFLYRSV
jgi:hypothetical protein